MLVLLLAANLGVSHFTASGPKACQAAVREGVLDLHSFMYDDAREAFQRGEACPIAFWGEAMTYDHALWGEQDTAHLKAALSRIPAGAKFSPMEKGLVEAAHALAEGGHRAWMEKLAALHAQLPKDDEVSLFYALSLYAVSDWGRNPALAKQAADIAEEVFKRSPDHPGAAHYLIHATDSPQTAQRGLAAARRYAQIAPAASHALHMPSHIFVQLGMWKDVQASNLAAVKAGEEAALRRTHSLVRADWHSYSWLASARIELGHPEEVLPMIARVRELAAATRDLELRAVQTELALKYLSATQDYARTEELLKMDPLPAEDEPGYVDTELAAQGCHHAAYELENRSLATRARLDAAAADGDEPLTVKLAQDYQSLRARMAARNGYSGNDAKLLTAAKIAQAHSVRNTGDVGDAINATRAAADAEDAKPASGPWSWTPLREELGDLFLRSHRFAEAEDAFRAALAKRPNRRHALEGLAEAARSTGDAQAADDAHARLQAQ